MVTVDGEPEIVPAEALACREAVSSGSLPGRRRGAVEEPPSAVGTVATENTVQRPTFSGATKVVAPNAPRSAGKDPTKAAEKSAASLAMPPSTPHRPPGRVPTVGVEEHPVRPVRLHVEPEEPLLGKDHVRDAGP